MKRLLIELYKSIYRFVNRTKTEYTWKKHIIRKKYRDSFVALKDIHKGKRCFIIGNGPSLTSADLTLLKNEYSFAANRIFYIFNKTDWRPTYYCAQDKIVIDDILNELPKIATQSKKMFLISDCYNDVSPNLRSDENVLFYCANYVSNYKKRIFSDTIEKSISGGGTITYASIQIAAYMGFSEIYLLGVDHNYSTPSFNKNNEVDSKDVKSSYFEGMPSNIKMTKPNTDNATLSFMKAKEYCDANGIKIANATRGGKLEVFPRIQLEEVLKIK